MTTPWHCTTDRVTWPGCGRCRDCREIAPEIFAQARQLVAQNAELANKLNDVAAERDSLRRVVEAVEAPEAIEAAAMALYEDTRDPGYDGPEWDWPNIDRSYDKDDEDETDPEWLRNLYRREARVAIHAALAAAADAPQPEPATKEPKR